MPALKGIHLAIKSGMLAAQAFADALLNNETSETSLKQYETILRNAISIGYDEAYLLSDRRLGGSDTYATALAISTMLKHLGFTKDSKDPFIILAGRQTSDGDTAHVPSQVAENIGIPPRKP